MGHVHILTTPRHVVYGFRTVFCNKGKKVRCCIAWYVGIQSLTVQRQSTSHFTLWQICQFQRHLELSGKHSATAAMTMSRLVVHLSTSVCSQVLIQLGELWQCGVEIAKVSRGLKPGFSRFHCATVPCNYLIHIDI